MFDQNPRKNRRRNRNGKKKLEQPAESSVSKARKKNRGGKGIVALAKGGIYRTISTPAKGHNMSDLTLDFFLLGTDSAASVDYSKRLGNFMLKEEKYLTNGSNRKAPFKATSGAEVLRANYTTTIKHELAFHVSFDLESHFNSSLAICLSRTL
ncbi:hypothetical protein ZIOFF_023713 [Zingiber officinale]|uniref:Uncharacterized protein n=1 Tax=Zingiber officinale TaxID=94328 RepID=A0A8J5H1A0_ZINOF|nr:hypothetical protein ZIOFF_023713 [Zingiber officinale]